MKIICEREKLLKAINAVVRGVPTRTTMPILEGIYIQTNNNELKLTTYDLELGIEYIIESTIEEEGNTVVNATMFSEIITLANEHKVTEILELEYVEGNERAKALYEKFDFKEVCIKPKAYKLRDGRYQSLVYMQKYL